jgi:hypothetical protein
MKLAAASVLEKKVCGVLATDVARVSAVEELTKNGLRPLVEILTATASSTQLLYKTVVILISIFNGTCAVCVCVCVCARAVCVVICCCPPHKPVADCFFFF